jgi:hypothetical protein
MTDLTYSGIWKISRDGKKVDLWSAHPLLNWSSKPYSGAPLGVNDLVFDKAEKNIYAVILEHSLPKGFVQLFITGLFLERCCTSTRSRLYVRHPVKRSPRSRRFVALSSTTRTEILDKRP